MFGMVELAPRTYANLDGPSLWIPRPCLATRLCSGAGTYSACVTAAARCRTIVAVNTAAVAAVAASSRNPTA